MSALAPGLQLRVEETQHLSVRLFATPADEPRARRASDVVKLVSCSAGLVAVCFAASPAPGFAVALARFLSALPSFLDGAWQILSDLLGLLAVLLAVGTLVRRRWSITRDLLLAVCVAVAVSVVVGRVVDGAWPAIWDLLRAVSPPPLYPALRVALCGSVVLTISPHLTRPVRRLGEWLVVLGALALTALGAATPLGAVAGLLTATIAAACIHLTFGSSAGRPGLDLVGAALGELGVAAKSLSAADRQQAGLFVVSGTDNEGGSLVVKIYGRDAHDAALMSTLWRTIWYRESGSPLRFGRLHQVEHEAFLTLHAERAGIVTDEVVTAGSTAGNDALLVLRRSVDTLSETRPRTDDNVVVSGVWSLMRHLGNVGVSHGQIDELHLIVRGDELGLVDFRAGTAAASESQRRADQVQALVTTAALVGEDRAATSAHDALGAQELEAMLPYLQLPTLTPIQRSEVRAGRIDLDRLRECAASAAGTEPPPLIQLRRVTAGSIVRVVLPALALLALISILAGLDLAELADQLREAAWWILLVAFLLAQTPRLTQAISTLGAAPLPLPLGPVYALQLATSYINMAVPSAAGRVGMGIRFFQRHGVPPNSAIAAGAIDTGTSFVVEAALVVGLVLFAPSSLDLNLDAATESAWSLLVVVIVIAAAAIVLVAVVAPWRRFTVRWVSRIYAELGTAVRGLSSPRRIAMLVGGNLATEFLFAIALATFAQAFGYPIGLGEALLINTSAAFLAAVIPIPGGIGVAEAVLAFGLVHTGVPEEVALTIALSYRLSTSYLPPIWGFVAFRWLERNDHL